MTELKSYEIQLMDILNHADECDQRGEDDDAYDLLDEAERLIKCAKKYLHAKYRISGTV